MAKKISRLGFFMLVAVLFGLLEMVVEAEQPESHLDLLLTNTSGLPISWFQNIQLKAFSDSRRGLEEVPIQDGRLPYWPPSTRYQLQVQVGRSFVKSRVVNLTGPETQLWIAPPSPPIHEVGPGSAWLQGRAIGEIDAAWELGAKLMSIPAFEEVGDYRLSEDRKYRFDGLNSGVYLLIVAARPVGYGLSRIVGSKEVIICDRAEGQSLDIDVDEPVAVASACPPKGEVVR